MAAVGALGVGRVAAGMGRGLFGGTNRYGRERTGIFNYAARGANAIGERVGGDKYSGSKGAAFVRALGRMGGKSSPYGGSRAGANAGAAVGGKSSGLTAPKVLNGVRGTAGKVAGTALSGGLRTGNNESKSGAFKNNPTARK